LVSKFDDKEDTFGKVEVNMQIIHDEHGIMTKVPHFGLVENKTSLHATSNTNFLLRENQRIDGIILNLVKTGAIKSGTVVTTNIKFVERYSKSV
jgi:hypothetical protein